MAADLRPVVGQAPPNVVSIKSALTRLSANHREVRVQVDYEHVTNATPKWHRFLLPDGTLPRLAGGSDEAEENDATETVVENTTAEPAVDTPTPEATDQQGWDGEPWDPERYRRTLENARAAEKEARTLASRYRTEEGFLELARELGYELDASEDEPDISDDDDPSLAGYGIGPEDDPLAHQVQELSEWRQQREEAEFAQVVNSLAENVAEHIGELAQKADEPELTEQEMLMVIEKAAQSGFSLDNPESDLIEKAFDEHVAWRNAMAEAKHKKYLATKKAPTPPSRAGSAGVVDTTIDSNDSKTRKRIMADVLNARFSQR